MKKRQRVFESEIISSEELTRRVVNILASATVRLATEGEKKNENPNILAATAQPGDFPILPKRGPIPFGQKPGANGVEIDENEIALIKRIQELAAQELSSETIAKMLNKEDHQTKRSGRWTRTAVWRILNKLNGFPRS